MEELQVFGFEGKGVRVVEKNGEPWWVAKDVCEVLGLDQVSRALDRIDDDERGLVKVTHPQSESKVIDMAIVCESGLYNLIVRSDKPEAKRFRKWITSEVLPSIRKTGGYLSTAVDFTDPDNLQRVFDGWKADRLRLKEAKEKIAIDAPKVDFYNAVTDSRDAIEMKDAAKALNVSGYGRNRLFQFLRDSKILMSNNTPYQSFIDRGYFRVIEQKYQTADGETHISLKTVVYQKGLDFIRKAIEESK